MAASDRTCVVSSKYSLLTKVIDGGGGSPLGNTQLSMGICLYSITAAPPLCRCCITVEQKDKSNCS